MYDVLDLQASEQDGRVFHTALLEVGGKTYPVDTRFGSWRVHVDGKVRDLIPAVAADLQAEVAGPKVRRR